MIRTSLIGLGSLALGVLTGAAASPPSPDFTREVRPILARHCFKCHGPDEDTRKGKLRLDRRSDALQPAKSGEIAIVPGNPEASELVRRILSSEDEDRMPPPSTKSELTPAEKEILRRWIQAGAEYRDHWAFVPPVQPPLPMVSDPTWPRNPVDFFILEGIEKAGLRPSPEADRHTLIRRLHLDLIGLLPTTAEVDAFVNDPSPTAYERLVDGLLASPRYGERWARRWLDLARYADTNGYEKDRPRTMWPYRDWVVRALNADLPFDQFTIEQIAGDLLPDATLDQRIATGFHRNTMINEEGGIDPLEFRFHAQTDRVATTGATWLGLTLQCAQCHTHKYDPIPQSEYYAVMAFLDDADEPELDLPDPRVEAAHRRNLAEADRLTGVLAERFPIESHVWRTPPVVRVETTADTSPRTLDDQSLLFPPGGPETEDVTVILDTDWNGIDQLRLEALPDESLESKGPGRSGHGNFVLSEIRVLAAPRDGSAPPRAVPLVNPKASAEQKDFPVGNAIDGKRETGWAVHVEGRPLNDRHVATFGFEQPVGFPGGTRFTVRLEQQFGKRHTLGRLRLAIARPDPDPRPEAERRLEAVDRAFAAWLERERERTVRWTPLRPDGLKSNLPLLDVLPDGSVLASGDITKTDTYELRFDNLPAGVTAVRLEALPDDSLPAHGPGLCYYEGPKGDFFLGEIEFTSAGRAVKVASASESYARNAFGSASTAALATDGDPQTGWTCAERYGERHEAVFRLGEATAAGAGLDVRMLFGRHYACPLGRFRISVTTDPAARAAARDLPEEAVALLLRPATELDAAGRDRLRREFLLRAPELAPARAEIDKLRRRPVTTTTLVMRERPPGRGRTTHVHKRGEFLQPTVPVEPGVLGALHPFPPGAPTNRLGFARWLVSPANPLTPRVVVNRQWAAFFGRGLVRTEADFGLQGELPTHPALLDWLAVDFVRQGWSMKRLHKQLVMSATYRQDSRVRPTDRDRDPDNRWLARAPRVRLEAELVRDAALGAGGLLSQRMGGPGVRPPQPEGVTETAYGDSKWTVSSGEDRYRRSLYTFAKRTAPFAFFNTFDAPSGEACVARRDVSNTPLQALTVLNDVTFVEASRALGRQLAARNDPVPDRVREAFRRCLTRPPAPSEVAALTRFLDVQRGRLAAGELDATALAGEGPGDAVERAAWTLLVRVLFNLDEMITRG